MLATRDISVRVLIAVAGVVLALLSAEIAVRVHLAERQRANTLEAVDAELAHADAGREDGLAILVQVSEDPTLFYELRPELDVSFRGVRVVTNAAGMREDREFTRSKPEGTVRIAGLGDSGMFGWDVEQGEDWLSVAEGELVRDGVRVEALNFAVPGYNTQLEVTTLERKALAFEPDVVVLGWCANDVKLPVFLLDKEELRWDVSYLWRFLFDRERLDVALGVRLARPGDQVHPVAEVLREGMGPEGVERQLRRLRALADEHGIHVLVFGPLGPGVARVVERVGLDALNTFDAVPPGEPAQSQGVWDLHPTREGHEVLGRLLADELRRRGWVEPNRR